MRKVFALVAVLVAFVAPGASQDPTTEPRVFAPDVVYEGAFRLPAGSGDCSRFNYGGSVLAYDPWRQSIWAVGHAQCQPMAEITIPTPVNGALSALPRAALKGAWIQTPWRSQVMSSTVNIGGILPQANGDLIVSAYAFYDSNNAQVTSHFRLSNGAVSGPVRFNTSAHTVNPNKAGAVAGWMGWIPQEWQALFGGPAFTSACCRSIIARTSLGPAFTVFDPAHVAGTNPVPSKELLGYPITHPTIGETPDTFDPANGVWYNGSVNNSFAGVVWINGTRTILAVQKVGTGTVTYNAGYNAGANVIAVLAYDANDLLAVKNGTKKAYDVVPYADWPLPAPLGNLNINTDEQGITYDPVNRRLFMTIHTGISGGEHVVLVYKVNAGTVTPPPPPPPADTAPPSVIVDADPINAIAGTTVSLAADALDNVGVTNVVFAVNGQPVGTDQTAPYQSSFTPTNAGSYQVSATAYDAAGLSATDTVTVTVALPPPPPPPPPPVDPCLQNPGVLVVSQWPGAAEGSRRLTYSYTVAGVVVTVKAVTLTWGPPDHLTVTDARGCAAMVTR